MNAAVPAEALCRYYRWHARIYDLTRWGFLFGRRTLLETASASRPRRILEIGCGTGANLDLLARLNPEATLSGIDVSPAMLSVAGRKLAPLGARAELRSGFYLAPLGLDPAPDLTVISYCLSMVNPGWEQVLMSAVADLAPGGRLAVVDFHGSRSAGFRRWMSCNHVRMEEHLVPRLSVALPRHRLQMRRAFGGLWRFFLFLGFKEPKGDEYPSRDEWQHPLEVGRA